MQTNSQSETWPQNAKNVQVSDRTQEISENLRDEECLPPDPLKIYVKSLGQYSRRKRHRCVSSELSRIKPS